MQLKEQSNLILPINYQIENEMDNSEFLKYFKSISIYPKIDENNNDFIPTTTSIIEWIGKFQTYFQQKIDLNNEENYHLLKNREISIHVEGVLRCFERIIEIATFSNSLGYVYSITLEIKELISNFSKIEKLVSDKIITSLGIVIDESDEILLNDNYANECAMILLKTADFRINIGLMASIETLYKLEVLNASCFNSLSFTIHPINKKPNEYFNTSPVTSCARHFKILINDDGLIYSCLGLFGIKEFSIGSIYSPLEETFFATGKSKLNFRELISHGFQIKPEDIQNNKRRLTGIPQMCELHRISINDSLYNT